MEGAWFHRVLVLVQAWVWSDVVWCEGPLLARSCGPGAGMRARGEQDGK